MIELETWIALVFVLVAYVVCIWFIGRMMAINPHDDEE